MDRRTLRTGLSVAWVLVGIGQVVSGVLGDQPLFAALGAVYALLGVAYYWAEVYREERAN